MRGMWLGILGIIRGAKMIWCDFVVVVGGSVIFLALLLSVFGSDKSARRNSLRVGLVLVVLVAVYLSVRLSLRGQV